MWASDHADQRLRLGASMPANQSQTIARRSVVIVVDVDDHEALNCGRYRFSLDLTASIRRYGGSMRHTRREFSLMTLSAAAALGVVPFAPAHARPRNSFLNSLEVRSSDLKAFKKWRGALHRYTKENEKNLKVKCPPGKFQICSYDDWMAFLKKVEGKDKITQLRLVNAKMNRAPYVQDNQNWGHSDYWASPAEFMARFGDCEDYAIIKYLSLKKLGWEQADLRVVAVKDLNLKVGHAILVVFVVHPKTKKRIALVLDNQIKRVVPASKIRHYKPIFSINETHWWRHLSVSPS